MKTEDEINLLKDALAHLLEELRIDERCLEVMANGSSPNAHKIDCIEGEEYSYPYPVIQLAKDTAKKIKKFDLSDFLV